MDGDRTTALATQRKPTNFEIELANYAPQIAAVLPAHIPLDRFKRIVITAVNLNPDLLSAERRSFFNSCVMAAKDGLLPDGREAALVIFNTKNQRTDQWEKKVQYMPMIQGIRKRMRNTGEVTFANAEVVYSNDEFDYQKGDEERIYHKPALAERGKPVGAYAIIKLKNGEVIREWMPYADIERARAVSRSKDKGPWATWWDEMARKTVLRRASKAAPGSSEIETLFRRDDMLGIEAAPEAPLIEAPPRPTRAQFQIPQTVEPQTGEVVDEGAEQPAGDVAIEVAEEMKRDEQTKPKPRSFTFKTGPRKTVTADSIAKWRDLFIADINETAPGRIDGFRDLNAPILDDLRDEFPEHVAAVCDAFERRAAE